MIITKELGNRNLPKFSQLLHSWQINHDGAGIMFSDKSSKVKFVKGISTFSDFMKIYEESPFYDKPEDYAVAIHFRMATHGGRSPGHCHPFPTEYDVSAELLKTYGEFGKMMMHNGVLSDSISRLTKEQKEEDYSDTMGLIENVLYYNPKEANLALEGKIGYNKLVFMEEGGSMYHVNKNLGQELPNGLWFSNKLYSSHY